MVLTNPSFQCNPLAFPLTAVHFLLSTFLSLNIAHLLQTATYCVACFAILIKYTLLNADTMLLSCILMCVRQLKSHNIYVDFVVEIVYQSPMVTLYINVDVFVVMFREVLQDRKKAQPAENVCLKEDKYCLRLKILMAALLLIIIW